MRAAGAAAQSASAAGVLFWSTLVMVMLDLLRLRVPIGFRCSLPPQPLFILQQFSLDEFHPPLVHPFFHRHHENEPDSGENQYHDRENEPHHGEFAVVTHRLYRQIEPTAA